MDELLPNKAQARKLVVSLALFWTAAPVATLGALGPAAISVVAILVGLVSGTRFYLTLYEVWQPETGVSPLRMMFVPGFSKGRRRATLHMIDLLRPSWIRHTLRVTGWNARLVGFCLLALLLVGLVLMFTVLPQVHET